MLYNIESVQLSPSQILEPKMRVSFITRPRRYLNGTAIFIAIFIFLYYMELIIITINLWTGDALPSAEDPYFSPKARSIFFHETFRSGLSVRQACAVEAAARAHPKREIYVLFSLPVTAYELKTGCLAVLLQFPNVKFLRVHEAEYSNGTVVQSMLLNDVILSTYRVQHTADILRILTLSKWGGMYLDSDMIITRSLDHLPSNFIAKETEADIASAILSFAKDEIGTNVTNEIIKEIGKGYNRLDWAGIGSEAIEKVVKRLCPKVINSQDYQTKPFTDCKGITIFDYELFYPHHFSSFEDIFKPPPEGFDLYRPYSYHMYDFLSRYVIIRRGTIYDLVAKAFCPTIYSTYSDEFSTKIIKP